MDLKKVYLAKQFRVMRSIQKCTKTSNIPNIKCAGFSQTVAHWSGIFYNTYLAGGCGIAEGVCSFGQILVEIFSTQALLKVGKIMRWPNCVNFP
jgi:hypothetical protein